MASSEPPSDRWRKLVDRAAPAVRAVDDAITKNETLKAVRADVVERVTDVIANVTQPQPSTVEGTVASDAAPEPAATSVAASRASSPSRAASSAANTAPSETASSHWTRDRVRRMAMAAGREAVRPAAPRTQRSMLLAVAVPAVLLVLLLVTVLRRRR